MLKLLGFSSSNYYNVAKLALLEKGIEFEEVLTWTGANEDFQPEYLDQSPMGKVPCLLTEEGPISESRCIVQYLEEVFPVPPLVPESPFGRARVHELCVMIDLYIELPARRTLPYYFAGKPTPERLQRELRTGLEKAIKALSRRSDFEPFLAGERLSLADVAACMHLPVARRLAKAALGDDLFAELPGLDAYLERMEARDTVKRVRADQADNYPKFVALIRERHGQR